MTSGVDSHRRRFRGVGRTLLALAVAAAAGACATAPESADEPVVVSERDPYLVVPEDFTLDVEMRAILPVGPAPMRFDPETRPARYVLFPDGRLHAGLPETSDRAWYDRAPQTGESGPFDGRGGGDWRPAPVRQLSPGDVAAVWTELRDLGFLASARPAGSNRELDLPTDGRVIIVDILANGTHLWWTQTVPPGESLDPAAAALLERLASRAWLTGRGPANIRHAPRRYDLGPDPYARYR